MVYSTWIQSSFLGPCPSSDQYELMAFIGGFDGFNLWCSQELICFSVSVVPSD
jgi:hypothetical protein